MKILHIAPNAVYNDYWGYQDNLLPKYQRKLGHEVTVITTDKTFQDAVIVHIKPSHYVLNDGVEIFRLPYKRYFDPRVTNILSDMDIRSILTEKKPDFIFYHSLSSKTICQVIRYKKRENPDCVVVEDNHLDYFNFPTSKKLTYHLIRWYERLLNKISIPYVAGVYGVTPWRQVFAEDYYGIPKDKTDVLIMGADDEKINFSEKDVIRNKIRMQFNIATKDFVIVTGGKLDKNKNVIELMEACRSFPNVHLLIFGKPLDDIRDNYCRLVSENSNIHDLGWIDADKVYDYFFAADLVCFPGSHSVLWEQACACKVPCLFRDWEGMHHVDNGGNSEFLTSPDASSIRKKLESLIFTEKYQHMKEIALSEATDIYLYSHIAEKSLEHANSADGSIQKST